MRRLEETVAESLRWRAGVLLLLALVWLLPTAARADGGLLMQAQSAHWIAEGHGDRRVYVIFDPNCPYCHKVYQEAQRHLKGFQFRWIPVAILTSSSRGKAAALLMARDKVAALRTNEEHFVRARGELGGIAPLRNIPASIRARLQDNLDLLQASGAPVVPKLLFVGRQGRTHLVEGALSSADFSDMLHDVGPGG